MKTYKHPEKSHVRYTFLIGDRHCHIAYIGKNKKKDIPRKAKYKEKLYIA